MDGNISKLKPEQVQQLISESVQNWFKSQLNYQFKDITCQIFDNKVAIVLENSLPQSIHLLANQGKKQLVQQVISNIEATIKTKLIDLIQELLSIEVVDLLIHCNIETSRTGIIAILGKTVGEN